MKTINVIFAYDLISKTEGRIFTSEFIKKDGTLRTINCRLDVKKGTNGNGLKYYPIEKGLLPVYDMQKQGFRMLNLLTLQKLTVNGQTYIIQR